MVFNKIQFLKSSKDFSIENCHSCMGFVIDADLMHPNYLGCRTTRDRDRGGRERGRPKKCLRRIVIIIQINFFLFHFQIINFLIFLLDSNIIYGIYQT